MNCERHKNGLLDAAATNGKLGAGLARHVEGCPKCRTTLEAERQLFSRIDNTVRARVNECPQPGFLAQVRVQLSKETSADAGSSPIWSATGAAMALILIAMIYPLLTARQPRVQEKSTAPTRTMRASQSAGLTQPAYAVSEASDVRSRRHASRRSEPKSAIPPEPEVLVPLDEQKAFAQFAARLAGRDVMAEAVVSPAANKTAARNSDLPQVTSVDIADLLLDRAQDDEWADDAGGSE